MAEGAGNTAPAAAKWEAYHAAPGTPPWECDGAVPQLLACLERHAGPWDSAVEIGCGSGRSTLALSQAGFSTVVGVDIAPTAIAACRANAAACGNAAVQWECGDMFEVLPSATPAGGFSFLFDCQVMHTLHEQERARLGRVIATALAPGGTALLITGNAQDGRAEAGPSMLGGVEAVQPLLGAGLHLLHLVSSSFAPTPAYGEAPPGAWVALVRKPNSDTVPVVSPLAVHAPGAQEEASKCSAADASIKESC